MAWPDHKAHCKQVAALKSIAKELKATGSNLELRGPSQYRLDDWRSKDMIISDTSAIGCLNTSWMPSRGSSKLHLSWFGPKFKVVKSETIEFRKLSDLEPVLEFLLSCGPLPDLANAQRILPEALKYLDDYRPQSSSDSACLMMIQPMGHNALEWAAKKGCVAKPAHTHPTLLSPPHAPPTYRNLDIVKWLLTDPRTASLVHSGAPVGWACYTGRVEIAKLLVSHGASSHATDEAMYFHRAPLLMAAENGKLEAMRWLVEEQGHDIRTVQSTSDGDRGVLDALRDVGPAAMEDPDRRRCIQWARRMLAEAEGRPRQPVPDPAPNKAGRTWTHAKGITGPLPPLGPAAEPKTCPLFSPFMLSALQLCQSCGAAPPAGEVFAACSCCELIRYCSVSCQKRAFERGHRTSCGSPFPSQVELKGKPVATHVAVLREFGTAHAYLVDTCAALLHQFTTKRMAAVQAAVGEEPPSDDGLAEMREMIDAGATEACLWAIRAHAGDRQSRHALGESPQIAASAISKAAHLLTYMLLSARMDGDAVRRRCVAPAIPAQRRLLLS